MHMLFLVYAYLTISQGHMHSRHISDRQYSGILENIFYREHIL